MWRYEDENLITIENDYLTISNFDIRSEKIIYKYLEHYKTNNIIRGGIPMFSNIGIPGLILILGLALIIFGPKKLPEVGKAFGQTLREFKNSARELTEDVITDNEDEKKKLTK